MKFIRQDWGNDLTYNIEGYNIGRHGVSSRDRRETAVAIAAQDPLHPYEGPCAAVIAVNMLSWWEEDEEA